MSNTETPRLVPYEMTEPEIEGIYTGEKSQTVSDSTDDEGNVIQRWRPQIWGSEAEEALLKKMQAELGHLEERTRQIRAHISSLTPCDSVSAD